VTVTPDIVLERIARWATTLCTLTRTDLPSAVVALELPGHLEHSKGWGMMTEAPAGMLPPQLTAREDGLFSVHLVLSGVTLTLADVERLLGAGSVVAGRPDASTTNVWFTARVPGAAHECSVFAEVIGESRPTAPVMSLLLRRDPARPGR